MNDWNIPGENYYEQAYNVISDTSSLVVHMTDADNGTWGIHVTHINDSFVDQIESATGKQTVDSVYVKYKNSFLGWISLWICMLGRTVQISI